MFHYRTGNILDFHDTEDGAISTVAIPANTMGVMGKGLALQFKQRYPELYESYKTKLGHIKRVGLDPMNPFLIGNRNQFMIFPTKVHWRNKSKLEWIQSGLEHIRYRMGGNFYDLALPPIGCGLGGLDWEDVEPLILDILDVHYNVFMFPPKEKLFTDDMSKSSETNMANWIFGN